MTAWVRSPAVPVGAEWVKERCIRAQAIPALGGPAVSGLRESVGEHDPPAGGGHPQLSTPREPQAASHDAAQVLRRIGLIQLDPLMRVSTAQRLTALTRLPRSARVDQVDAALWPGPEHRAVCFESFTKVACILPVEDWPLMRLRRRAEEHRWRRDLPETLHNEVLEVVRSHEGGIRLGTLEAAFGAERTSGWAQSGVKRIADALVRSGELVITNRDGTVRLFDLPQRALPADILALDELSDAAVQQALAHRAAGTLAVMTVADFAHHYHLNKADAAAAITAAGLQEVHVEGWSAPGFCSPELLDDAAGDQQGYAPERKTTSPQPSSLGDVSGVGDPQNARLIGPFDPLLRDRARARRIFDFAYTFEAYVPRAKRQYGHYVMAVLCGTELIGRVDVQRVDQRLVLNQVWAESGYQLAQVTESATAGAETLAEQLRVEAVWA